MIANMADELKANDAGATLSVNSGLLSHTSMNNTDSIEELSKEVEALKKKLIEERAKFNDVECKTF
jgi:hypothetical protein